jgi:hypothetical protein
LGEISGVAILQSLVAILQKQENRPFSHRNGRFCYFRLSTNSVGVIPVIFWKFLQAVER